MKQLKTILAVGGVMALLAACVTDNYPIKTCIVSGEALGSMGEPFKYVHEGTTVKFCCEGCLDEFKENPTKFLAKLNAGGQPPAKTVPPPVPAPSKK